MAPSPFVQRKKNGRTAFIVVLLFAGISAAGAVAGVYRAFIRNPVPSATTELTSATPNLFTPPAEVRPPPAKPAEPEKTEQTPAAPAEQPSAPVGNEAAIAPQQAASLVTEPQAPAAPGPVSTGDPEIDALRNVRDAEIEKKIREIEKLDGERAKAAENDPPPAKPAKPEKTVQTPAAPVSTPVPAPDIADGKSIEGLLDPSGTIRFAKTKDELPQPDLIQGNFMSSLPNFALIKPKSGSSAIPLHLIDPLPEMQEKNKYGRLPKKDSAGNSPLKAYAAPAVPPQSPYIAFLLTGLGRRRNVTQSAITVMPSFVSLSFSPYSQNFDADVREARQTGHETLIDLPMQHGSFPESYPGPLGLVAGFSEQDNRARLYKVMARSVAYIGLTAQHNQNFSYYESAQMKAFVAEIDRRGLALIAGTDDKNMPVYRQTLRPDVYIADNMYRSAIRARLEKAKKIALEKGGAFVRVDALPISMITMLEFITEYLPKDEKTIPEISFVPLSYHIEKTRENKK